MLTPNLNKGVDMPPQEGPPDKERSVIKCLSLGGTQGGGAACVVDVKDGRAIRVRPLHFDWKYDLTDVKSWEIRRNGKTLRPQMMATPAPFSLAYKKRVYSPNRIKYPLKRVDWDPSGERNTHNRGVSKYKRISWDEATDIIAGEIRRIHREYGPYGILTQADGHSECKQLHAPHGCITLLLHKLGGYTQQARNPDSWEGWYFGAKHVWGDGNVGMMSPAQNTCKDISEHADLVLHWGCDPETNPWGFGGQGGTSISYFWTEAGIEQVYICPDLNYGAAVHADKWIPVLPNSDAALQLAVAYMWITEGTYDKEYVATHTVGFDKFSDYVLGNRDAVAKTPEWASPKCGVPVWTIKALARKFAKNTTAIAHYFGGGMIRGPYSSEPARLEVILLGMQGLGGPGVHHCQLSYSGMPRSHAPASTMRRNMQAAPPGPQSGHPRLPELHMATVSLYAKQFIPKTLIQEAILNPPITFRGTGTIRATVADQFLEYTYPIPKEEGGTEIHMVWTDSPCRVTCWNDGNKTVEAMRSPKIECIVAQHPWLENDCLMADVILPANTTFEVDDIVANSRNGAGLPNVGLQRQAIKPIGESKSDYEIVLEVAKKLGVYEEVSEGKTIEDWLRYFFDEYYKVSDYISWEEFNEKQYFLYPLAEDWEDDPPGLRRFFEDPTGNPLPTPSGKLEFYSKRLAERFPDDEERPPVPAWVEQGISHDERPSGERAKQYPLMLMSNHGRWRTHAQGDDISWTREITTCKVRGWDGYLYEPLWVHPSDAADRDIKTGDIVKVFNERGVVLCGALVLERVIPGAVYVDHGARADFIVPGVIDRGGAINLISPLKTLSKNCLGQATTGYLVELEKLSMAEMEEWKKQYPEAFSRDYDPASGLRFSAWIENGAS
jgi:molybdopterin guanine dinucleotide-containing S/N-oxide reductase-like protein